MNTPDELQALQQLVDRGAILWCLDGKFPLGAVIVRGDRVVWAQQGAEDQHHIHLLDGVKFRVVSPNMVDWLRTDGSLYGTLEAMDAEEAAQERLPDWRRYLADPERAAEWRDGVNREANQLLD
jgi:hypothetical protein